MEFDAHMSIINDNQDNQILPLAKRLAQITAEREKIKMQRLLLKQKFELLGQEYINISHQIGESKKKAQRERDALNAQFAQEQEQERQAQQVQQEQEVQQEQQEQEAQQEQQTEAAPKGDTPEDRLIAIFREMFDEMKKQIQ